MLKLLISSIILTSSLFAKNACSLDGSILSLIATIEGHRKKDIGYPYLVSFNNKKDAKKIKSKLGSDIFLDNRTIDCKNRELCTKITNFLIYTENITNLDLGAFQINYTFHKMKTKDYFSFDESYKKACSFLEELVKRHGYSWETIARYHSGTPKYNYAYLKKISYIIKDKNWN